MRREIGNTLAAGSLIGLALVPAGCGGGSERPAPDVTPSFICNFSHPSTEILDSETTAISGLAVNIEQRYKVLSVQYHLDGGKPQPSTAIQEPLRGGGELVLSYHAHERTPRGTQAYAELADQVIATEYADQNGKEPEYSIELDQLCTGGWMGSWQKGDSEFVSTDAAYSVHTKSQPDASPSTLDDQQAAESVINQLVGQVQQLIDMQPGDAPIQLSTPKID